MSISAPTTERPGATLALAQVTVIVVTFNSAHCVPALAKALAQGPAVVVVDNGSHDDTCAAVRECLPQARLLALASNVGFGAANNQALATVTTPYALLLNPDCLIGAADVAALWHTAQQWPQAAIVVPQLVDGRGRPQVNYGWPRLLAHSRGPAAQGLLCVGNACGAVMLLRLDALPTREWFDTRFFLYYEDEDLCLRLFEARRPILVDPQVRVGHLNRGSVRGRRPLQLEYLRGRHHAMSKLLFTAKHLGQAQARRLRWRTLVLALLTLPLRVLAPSPRLVARLWGRICGLWQAPTRY